MDRGSGGEGGQHTIMVLGKVKSAYESSGPSVPALNSGFRSIKRLGILLLPPGWDASPSQGYPPAL